jgi:S-adenosylmethionine:tRNA ribosyltransferase-isomerase
VHLDGSPHSHHSFGDVIGILRPGDLLVLNNTRVTARRLFGQKPTGGEVELLLLKELAPLEFEALARPGRRLQPGARVLFGQEWAEILKNLPDGRKRVRVSSPSVVAELGLVPLPPYIHKSLSDPERYQTVYAEAGGSAAAPTAGLHFTPSLLDELRSRGVSTAWVTLDVGLDTFRPVSAENLDEHVMHGERCTVPAETVDAVASCSGRVIAVGTTAVRTLETFARGRRELEAGSTESRLFIRPGFQFQIVDGMFTNFHMPRTTMLMMISALAGRERIMSAYEEALERGYRFLSFGDSMLIL